MVYCAKSKTAKKRTWCKKTPCAVDSDNKSCILDGKTNRCRARISKKALPKKKSSKIIKKTKKTEEVAEVLPAPPLRRSARLNTAKGVAPPPKPMSKKASRAKVFNNKDLVTPGGLSTKDLVKSNGRIVSKVKSKNGKKNSWALAVKKARKELKIDGFAVIKKGEPIYDLAMKYYKGSVGGAEGLFVEAAMENIDVDVVDVLIDAFFGLGRAIWNVIKYGGPALKSFVGVKIAKLLAELEALNGENPKPRVADEYMTPSTEEKRVVVQGVYVPEEEEKEIVEKEEAPEWIDLGNGRLRRGPGHDGTKRLQELKRALDRGTSTPLSYGGGASEDSVEGASRPSAASSWRRARGAFDAVFRFKLGAMRKEAEAAEEAANIVINQEGISKKEQDLAESISTLANHTKSISDGEKIKSDVEQKAWLKKLEEVKNAFMRYKLSPQEGKRNKRPTNEN